MDEFANLLLVGFGIFRVLEGFLEEKIRNFYITFGSSFLYFGVSASIYRSIRRLGPVMQTSEASHKHCDSFFKFLF